jgi:hypothetical protein
MSKEVFQGLYLSLHLFLSLGIVGNMELGVQTPIYIWILYSITSFFVIGKIIYWHIKE